MTHPYSKWDTSQAAQTYWMNHRHTNNHVNHPEHPHRHAHLCPMCAAARDAQDTGPGALRARLESLLADLVDADMQTFLDRPMVGDDGTTHYHRLTTTDLAAILIHLPMSEEQRQAQETSEYQAAAWKWGAEDAALSTPDERSNAQAHSLALLPPWAHTAYWEAYRAVRPEEE